ncbi:MAG: hypothetical protein R2911_33265 [Caldilineaceae bacterium]
MNRAARRWPSADGRKRRHQARNWALVYYAGHPRRPAYAHAGKSQHRHPR